MAESILPRVDRNGILRKMIDDLTVNEFVRKQAIDVERRPVDVDTFKKCVWIASLLAANDNDEDIQAVQLFAVLGFLEFSNDRALEKVTLLLLARIGNLTASRHLPNYSFIARGDEAVNAQEDFDSVLSYEVAARLDRSTLETTRRKIITTDFQKRLLDELRSANELSVSGPTSSGKSFIIKNHITSVFEQSDVAKCLYVVPSRALINQVSDDFHTDLGGSVEIKTAFAHESNENFFEKSILYILTPERCLKLLQQTEGSKLDFKVIFIDEIQNVEDESGRGSIMEYVITELKSRFPLSQFIVAGPNIGNAGEVYRSLAARTPAVIATTVSPVFQIKSVVRPRDENQLEVILQSTIGSEQSLIFNAQTDVGKILKANIGRGLAILLDLLASGQQNIVYSPRTDWVEAWAQKFATTRDEASVQIHQETADLIEFLSEEIHPKYSLIDCLKRGCAFHHGRLPDLVRREIEDGFLHGRIRTLFCTSTLLQGVNLPAQNLFIVAARKLTEELTPFEFGNLMGRAGRLRDSFYGTIFCIEKSREDEWAMEYYSASHEKTVTTAVEKSLVKPGSILAESAQPFHEIEKQGDQNTIVFLRQKFLKNREEFRAYLNSKSVAEDVAERIEQSTEEILRDISLPSDILRQNPSIDPLLQDQLFKEILQAGIARWCVTPGSNFEKRMRAADVPENFEDRPFYWQLVDIFERLDNIFKLRDEAYFGPNISLSIPQMCAYGKNWLDGLTYRELIQRDIQFYAVHQNERKRINPEDAGAINTRIKSIIDVYSTVVTFILVRYLKLLNDIIEPMMTEEQRDKYRFHLTLPNSLELGAREPAIRKLISAGVLRSVAIKIFGLFQKVQGYENLDIISWLRQQTTLSLKPIYLRYLQKLNLLRIS